VRPCGRGRQQADVPCRPAEPPPPHPHPYPIPADPSEKLAHDRCDIPRIPSPFFLSVLPPDSDRFLAPLSPPPPAALPSGAKGTPKGAPKAAAAVRWTVGARVEAVWLAKTHGRHWCVTHARAITCMHARTHARTQGDEYRIVRIKEGKEG
jgi:hypothetical protein